MTREEIIQHFTDNLKKFKQYAKNIAGDDYEDLFQECTLMLLEYSEERIVGYWNPSEGLKPFFIRLLLNQYRSNTSKYHKEYKKQNKFIQERGADILYHEDQVDIEKPEIDRVQIDRITENIHNIRETKTKQIDLFKNDLEGMIWELYVETGSLRKTLAAIPEEHRGRFDLKLVHNIVRTFRRTIKKNLDKAA